MSYQRRHGLGGVSDLIATGNAAAGIAASALTNPYTAEIICRVKQLEAANLRKPVPPCATTPPVNDSLGIRKFMPIVRGYVYAEQHPWAYPVAVALAVGVPFLLGYLAGRNR